MNSPREIWGKRIPGRGHRQCKGPGAGPAWCVGGTEEVCVAAVEGVRRREGGGQGGDGAGAQGPGDIWPIYNNLFPRFPAFTPASHHLFFIAQSH